MEDPEGGAISAVRILRNGGIPVLSVTTYPDGANPTLSIVESKDIKYVAISHVWSDGLGNPRNNTLPTCQLQKIQQWVDDLYPESSKHVPFWIDTLCVPLEKEVRKQAIRLMGKTYHASDKVLVLDGWLMKTEISGNYELDFLKLKSCTWTQRLWTLQEGMLAKHKSLLFQTQQGSISEEHLFEDSDSSTGYTTSVLRGLVGRNGDTLADEQPEITTAILNTLERHTTIWEDSPAHGFLSKYYDTANTEDQNKRGLISELHSWLIHNFVWVEGRDYFVSLRRPLAITSTNLPDRIRHAPINQSNDVLVVGHNMKNRSTSRIEDEAVCFATLLGLDIGPILDRPSTEERMELVFSQLKHVSAKIIFSHSRRIEKEGFRWAPATFRENTKTYEPGITFMNFGEIRPEGLVVRYDAIMLQREAGNKVAVPATQIEVDSSILSLRESGKRGLYPASRRVWDAALLFEKHGAPVSTLSTDAILIEMMKREDDVIFARFLGHYHMECKGPTDIYSPERLTGIVKREQRWCIG